MNLTTSGFIQDYDRPILRNKGLSEGEFTILRIPESKDESLKQHKFQSRKDELKWAEEKMIINLQQRFSGAVKYELNKLDREFLEKML